MTSANVQERGKLVFVAEDERYLAFMLEEMLKEHGVEVRLARNGQEAIDLMEKELPDLLLLDLLMPKHDGYHVLEFMKHRQYQFPVVIMTNMNLELAAREELMVADILIKSDMDEDSIWLRIEKYLQD